MIHSQDGTILRMTFEEAIALAKEGKAVKRPEWQSCRLIYVDGYWLHYDGGIYITFVPTEADETATDYCPA
jgi:hypothetical protein